VSFSGAVSIKRLSSIARIVIVLIAHGINSDQNGLGHSVDAIVMNSDYQKMES
jgi:hypothetical protein